MSHILKWGALPVMTVAVIAVVICCRNTDRSFDQATTWASQPSVQTSQSTATNKPTQPVSRSRGYIYGGLPKAEKGSEYKVLENKGYVVGYSERHKDPVWAAYRLYKVDNPQKFPRPSRFSVDERTEAKVSQNDYAGSGYDRGHMAPNSAIMMRFGREAQIETFLMSNICPQKPNLNRGMWEELESRESSVYANRFEEIWVIDGPIFGANTEKMQCGVDIPVAFFKIIVDEENGKPRMLGFIMPQDTKGSDMKAFLVSVEEIEKKTGLDFFTELGEETEKILESEKPAEPW